MAKVDVTLVSGKDAVQQPWISKLCREFRVEVHIKKASIDPDYGWMLIELDGPIEEIQRATAWLMTTGMHVEALQRAVGA